MENTMDTFDFASLFAQDEPKFTETKYRFNSFQAYVPGQVGTVTHRFEITHVGVEKFQVRCYRTNRSWSSTLRYDSCTSFMAAVETVIDATIQLIGKA